jgi:hypothetical protein
MKKMIKYIFVALLFVMTFGITIVSANAEETANYINLKDDLWMITDDFEDAPLTVEATIKLPKDYAERGGVIFSNYSNKYSKGYIIFEIFKKGNPSITFVDLNGQKIGGLFDKVNVATGEWVHLSLVIDGTKHLCYVDGELKGTKVFNNDYDPYIPVHKFGVGGDVRENNSEYFKGQIADIAVYSDARTASEVASDYASNEIDKSDLIVGYDLSVSEPTDIIQDLSNNNNVLRKQYEYDDNFKDPEPTDYDYSFAVIGDTQTINRDKRDHMDTIYDYIMDNLESKKIKHVAGMGDITDQSQEGEWIKATEQFTRMDGKVSYSLIRGNHDSSETYEQYLGYEANYCGYSKQYKEYFQNSTNTIHEFSAGNLDYLLVTLDFGPSDEVLEWASKRIAEHPFHNVIISTHGYLDTKGMLIRKSSTNSITQHGGYNDGVEIWEKLVSQHANIVLVLCGHEATPDVKILRTKGIHGNVVTQMLVDTQYVDRDDINAGNEGLGVVSMLYFSNGGKTIDFRYYATIKEQYFKTSNQFRMNINVVQRKFDAVKEGVVNLPTKDNIDLSYEKEINKLNELYVSLSDEEKATIDATKLVEALNKIEGLKAGIFDSKVLELPEILTLANEEEMLSLKEIYDNSSDYFKQNLSQKELYEKKINELLILVNQRESKLINNEILNLPYPLTLENKDKVLELRNRYDQLDEASKTNVKYISKLIEAESIISIFSQQLENALIVQELIDNLPDVIDLSCEEEVVSVRLKYSKLDSIAKGYVNNLDILEEAEAKISDAYSKKKAKELNLLILSLPDEMSLADKGVVEIIRQRYEALDEECKEYVSELFLLETFEARLKLLEELKVNVEALNQKIESLPEIITLKDKALVEELLAEYNNLSNDEKTLVNRADKLKASVKAIEDLEAPTEINIKLILIIFGSIIAAGGLGVGTWFVIKKVKKTRKENATDN